MEYSDRELIEQYLGGDDESLELLIKRYLKPVHGFVFRYAGSADRAEDIMQEVFIKAWRHIGRFDRSQSFKAWIFAIAKNTAIDTLKKKKEVPFSAFENEVGENSLTETLADPNPLPHELLDKAPAVRLLASALQQLSPPARLVLSLRYTDHYNFREIAESLGEPLHTIASRHRRALIQLKKLLIT